jgi:hypothetical protein
LRTHHVALAASLAALCAAGCYSPAQSQRYFAEAAAKDPVLEPLHETTLYTVYYDHALKRCVLHSAHSWGENGGGGGGTGIGVSVFPCDPARLKARAAEIREALKAGRRLVLPPPQAQPQGQVVTGPANGG